MKKNTSFLVTLCLMFSTISFAEGARKLTPEVLNSYLSIQESLASDSMNGISSAAYEIVKNTQDAKLKASAQALSHDTDLGPARKHFKELSSMVDRWAKTEKPDGVDRVLCPMENASWLQKHGTIKNPYFGKKMQGCGEVQK